MEGQFVLDALEQELYALRPAKDTLIHHCNGRSQYLFIRYSERLTEVNIAPSVGSVGAPALAETINGQYKAEVEHRRSWPTREALELATMKWVDWQNHRRLLGESGAFRRPRRRRLNIGNGSLCPRRRDSNQIASWIPEAVQF